MFRGCPPHPALAYCTTMESFAEWYSNNGLKQHVHQLTMCRMSLNHFGFALFYIYFFGILYIAVGVKIVF